MSDEIKLDDIPEYREAVERELELRSLPFIFDWPELICGIEVRPLTRNHLSKLKAVNCAFVCGKEPLAEDAILFLWIVSLEYESAMRWKERLLPFSYILAEGIFSFIRKKFRNRIKETSHADRVAGIWEYLSRMFLDSGGTSPGIFSAPFYSGSASQVAIFGKEFGFSWKDTLSLPIPCEFQLLNWLKAQDGPKSILWNPISDKVRRIALEKRTRN